jgi:hypothetical protein
MGDILRIDLVSKTTEKGEKFNRVFIHFKKWFSNENSDTARERLLNSKEIKIIYDDPWFWKVSAYREANKGPPRQEAKPTYKKPSLQFDSDEDIPVSSRNNNELRRPREDNIRPRDDNRRPRDDNRRPREDNRRPREDNRRPREDNRRPREDNRRPREDVINAIPRSPSNSPPRERIVVDYTQVIEKKQPFVIEEGEIV